MIFESGIQIKIETRRQMRLVLKKIEEETNLIWRTGHLPTKITINRPNYIFIHFDYITHGNSQYLDKETIKAEQII